MSPEPTDAQLARIVQVLAKLHLEIERGLRPAEQLATFMHPEQQHRWRYQRRHDPHLPGGAVHDTDLGPVHLRRTDTGQVHASLTTTTHPGRWGSLTFALTVTDGRVHLQHAQRLHAGRDYGLPTERPAPPPERSIEEQLALRRTERDLVKQALGATERRISVAPIGHPDTRQLHQNREQWQQQLLRITQDLAHLRAHPVPEERHAKGLRA
jgi:hypothetical protein